MLLTELTRQACHASAGGRPTLPLTEHHATRGRRWPPHVASWRSEPACNFEQGSQVLPSLCAPGVGTTASFDSTVTLGHAIRDVRAPALTHRLPWCRARICYVMLSF